MTEPVSNAVHLCLDMQKLFAPGGAWHTPWMEKVLPRIVSLVAHKPARTVFTRFIPPERPEDRPGRWQRYYQRWVCVTRAKLPREQLDLVEALAGHVPPAMVIDKPAYSAFTGTELDSFLKSKSINSLIVTGSETDVCVLASVLTAIDLGYRVIVVGDYICSSSDEGHDTLMTLYRSRFSEQIDLMSLEEVLSCWRGAD